MPGHSRRPGACKYPIEVGTVFRLKKPAYKFNPGLKTRCNHTVYLWVQRFATTRLPDGRQPKYRTLRMLTILVPDVNEDKVIVRENYLQLETLEKYLRESGYHKIGSQIYNYTKEAYRRFYQLIGVI